jgi:hypothetical protein
MKSFNDLDVKIENNRLKILNAKELELEISDGYHTFTELYDHRIALFLLSISLLKRLKSELRIWYANSEEDGWYIVGIDVERGKKTISYHLPISTKEYLDRWNVEYLDTLPPFDGCDSKCNLKRIMELL